MVIIKLLFILAAVFLLQWALPFYFSNTDDLIRFDGPRLPGFILLSSLLVSCYFVLRSLVQDVNMARDKRLPSQASAVTPSSAKTTLVSKEDPLKVAFAKNPLALVIFLVGVFSLPVLLQVLTTGAKSLSNPTAWRSILIGELALLACLIFGWFRLRRLSK